MSVTPLLHTTTALLHTSAWLPAWYGAHSITKKQAVGEFRKQTWRRRP